MHNLKYKQILRLSKRLRLSCLVPNLHSSELSCSYIKETICLKKRRSNGLSSFSVISLYHRTPWRTFLPHRRRIHAFTARGVILEHAVRCRASITLPATPAARLFFSPPTSTIETVLFIYLFFSLMCKKCIGTDDVARAIKCVWAWSKVSTCGGGGGARGGEAWSWNQSVEDNISGNAISAAVLTAGKCV